MIQIRPVSDLRNNFTERALDQADYSANNDSRRMTHDEVFGKLKESLDVKQDRDNNN